MPRIPGNDHTNGKCWNETYSPHSITVRYTEATLKASTGIGKNGAAILSRIDYIRRAMNIGLVKPENMRVAQATIANLEGQL